MKFTWPISKKLLSLILEDKVSDILVCELIWERLFYTKEYSTNKWVAGLLTPLYWSEKYNNEEYLFPVPNIPFALPDNKLEYALVMAVIRQESQFYLKVYILFHLADLLALNGAD